MMYIQSDTTWSSDTIKIFNNIIVEETGTLTILSGVYVEFQGHFSIIVNGKINAFGTENDSVVFSINDNNRFNDTATVEGGWAGIRFKQRLSNDSSIFEYCTFRYGKAVIPGDVGFYNESNNGGCISANKYPNIIISNSSFINNRANNFGAATYFSKCGVIQIEECCFRNNFTFKKGGGIYIEDADYFNIRGNLFYRNTAYEILGTSAESGGGSGIFVTQELSNGAGIIGSNKFYNNQSINGTIYESCFRIKVVNNIIANNYGVGLGEGVSTTFNALFANNTIVNNWGFIVPALWFNSTQTKMINNIVWGNGSATSYGHQIYSLLGNITANIDYSCIQDGYDGEGNTSKYPEFTNPTAGYGLEFDALNTDWSLLDGSPCVNMGTPDTIGYDLPNFDIANNPRIYGSRIDMGAYENQNVVGIAESKLVLSRIEIAPNPFMEKFSIILKNPNQVKRITISNQTGNSIKVIDNVGLDELIIVDLKGFKSGMYFLGIEHLDGYKVIEKVIKL